MNIRAIVLVSAIIGTFWIWLIYCIVTSSMSYNTLSSGLVSKKQLLFKSIFPEGFSFFTRDPREPQAIIYSKDSKRDLMEDAGSSIRSFFGLNRYGRALTIELGIILDAVNDQTWFDCYRSEMRTCFDDVRLPTYYLNNATPNPILCGEYYIKIIEPIPWAWANSYKEDRKEMPFKIIIVSIKCG